MSKTLYYKDAYKVSNSPYSTTILTISEIIHDGIQSRHELVKKFAAMTNRSWGKAHKCICDLEDRKELGYYRTIKTADGEDMKIFVLWDYKRAFKPSRAYNSPTYFDNWFRAKNGHVKNTNGLRVSEGFMYE